MSYHLKYYENDRFSLVLIIIVPLNTRTRFQCKTSWFSERTLTTGIYYINCILSMTLSWQLTFWYEDKGSIVWRRIAFRPALVPNDGGGGKAPHLRGGRWRHGGWINIIQQSPKKARLQCGVSAATLDTFNLRRSDDRLRRPCCFVSVFRRVLFSNLLFSALPYLTFNFLSPVHASNKIISDIWYTRFVVVKHTGCGKSNECLERYNEPAPVSILIFALNGDKLCACSVMFSGHVLVIMDLHIFNYKKFGRICSDLLSEIISDFVITRIWSKYLLVFKYKE